MAGQRSSGLPAIDTAERDSGGNARTSDQPVPRVPGTAGADQPQSLSTPEIRSSRVPYPCRICSAMCRADDEIEWAHIALLCA